MTLSQKFAKLQLVPADDSDCFLITFFQCTKERELKIEKISQILQTLKFLRKSFPNPLITKSLLQMAQIQMVTQWLNFLKA